MGGRRIVRIAMAAALALAACAPVAEAASVRWTTDRSPATGLVVVTAAPGENNDLEIAASDGPPGSPTVVTVTDRNATLTTIGTTPPPGSCDALQGCSIPCRIESPHVARCVIDDGFTTRRAINPLERPSRDFFRTQVFLADGDDRVTVPATSVWHRVVTHTDDGNNTYDFSRGAYTVWAGRNDTVSLGIGASGGVEVLSTGVSVQAVNGSANYAYCYGGFRPTLRFDLHDSAGYYCSDADVIPPQVVAPAPAPPTEEALTSLGTREELGPLTRCVEANLAAPGSCTMP